MTDFNFDALLNISADELTKRAAAHYMKVFDGDKEQVSQAMSFLVAADLNIGNTLRNHLITVVQSNVLDVERASTIIDEFLERNPPPSDEEALVLMAEPQNLEGDDSKKAALYLLAQPDLRNLYAELITALVPDLRVALVTEILEAPIGSRSFLTIDTQDESAPQDASDTDATDDGC